jgi:hypothetical protein
MAQLWGGLGDPSLYWDDLDKVAVNNSQLPVLGSYWDSFKNGGRRQHEQGLGITESTTTLPKIVDDSLDILLILEMVLRFSLEPLPPKSLEPAFLVYQSDLGYDMMPDQVASLAQSTFKVKMSNRAD